MPIEIASFPIYSRVFFHSLSSTFGRGYIFWNPSYSSQLWEVTASQRVPPRLHAFRGAHEAREGGDSSDPVDLWFQRGELHRKITPTFGIKEWNRRIGISWGTQIVHWRSLWIQQHTGHRGTPCLPWDRSRRSSTPRVFFRDKKTWQPIPRGFQCSSLYIYISLSIYIYICIYTYTYIYI